MIFSMTGFAVAAQELPYGTLNIELRSVNHRYLDVQFRIPDDLRTLEPAMRELVVSRFKRGKIDCRLGFTVLETAKTQHDLNSELLARLGELSRIIQASIPDCQSLRVIDILRWPGIFGPDTLPEEDLRETCLQLLKIATDELSTGRGREGEKLKEMLIQRLDAMEALVTDVGPRIPGAIAAFQEKLTGRLREAMVNCDDDRIRQELTLFAGKIDVDEELSRLRTHIDETRRVLNQGGVVGKRLDFLMQELNREANTLGSKAVDAEVSSVSVELKVLIEQMREQIQNIE